MVTTSQTADLFSTYAVFVEGCVKKNSEVMPGFEHDDLKDLVNDLWTLHDNFSDGKDEAVGQREDEVGEDE